MRGKGLAACLMLSAWLGAGCSCGGTGLETCSSTDQCPGGYHCDLERRQCARDDGGNSAGDAASDGGTAGEGGWHDSARVDGNGADATAADATAADATAADATAADATAADATVADATAADAASRDLPVPDRVVSDLSRVDSGGGGDTSALPDVPVASDTATPPTDAAGPAIGVTITPRDGAVGVDVTSAIQLDFTLAMDADSVQGGGFCLRPVSGGCLAGQYSWINAASVTFTPTAPLAGSTIYVVIVRGSCAGQNGGAVVGSGGPDCAAPDVCTRFATNDGIAPTVVNVVPANAATGIALQPTITVTFSEPMDQASVVAHARTTGGDLSGTWTWSSSSIYQFSPAQTLDCAVEVRVLIDAGARDPSGLLLDASCPMIAGTAFCSSFTTRPTHEECRQCSTGCWDVNTANHGCNMCQAAVAAPGDTPPCSGASWCLGCLGCYGGYDCSCATHCHYHREERFVPCNCAQVCS